MLFFVCYRISSIQRTGIGNACVYPLPFFCIWSCIRTSAILVSILDNAHTVSICVVARIGTHGFSLVRSMGTQNSRGVVLLAILAKRLEILAVHAVLEPGLVDKDNHVGVFVPITIITAHDYFFNYTFKNMAVKSVQNLVLFKGLPECGNTLAHGSFGFGCILQAFTFFLQLLNLAGQV